ncbi:hypothetical protein KIW84_050759 [Lathyrus oleraceus]|uniref:Uncharacterized protein n=1 Tax=Pisum sativum TaxID=3888 RepID=A0A9D5ACJ3_PEA|nr:hypothetical protein KIW84_050759 [Pisum sativum]
MVKGVSLITVVNLKLKLMELWPSIRQWGVISLGKGFFKFAFSSLEYVHRVRYVNAWNLNSEKEFVDAIQIEEVIRETQAIVQYKKDKVKDFLEKSWANMADLTDEEDLEEDINPKLEFQLSTLKIRNKTSKAQNNTRSSSSQSKSSL